MKLFLDDIRNLKETHAYTYDGVYLESDWVIVRNYDQFCEYIKNNPLPELISFDHDLADEHYDLTEYQEGKINYEKYKEKTGYECAKYLMQHCLDTNQELPKILVHSMNDIGKMNILSYLRQFDTIKNMV